MDYLFKNLLAKESLFDTHGFIRDRTRSIRQDFTLQNERGPVAIECHERIARYHILCLHYFRDKEGTGSYQEQQELEQVRKVLQSLNEFYDDYRESNCFWPNEAEFRAYYLLTHLRDSDAARATERLPEKVFRDQRLQSALQLQILAQCGNMTRAPGRRPANSPATLNAFTRLFKKIKSSQTSFLNACLLETHFREIRVSALKALRSAQSRKYGVNVPLSEIARLCAMSLEECRGFCAACGLTMSDECTVELHRHAPFDDNVVTFRTSKSDFITAKGSSLSIVELVDGKTAAAPISSPTAIIPSSAKLNERPLILPAAKPQLPAPFPSPFIVVPSAQKSVTVDRSIFSPVRNIDTAAVPPTPLSTSSRAQQISPKFHRSAEHTSSRERTKRSGSLKASHASPSLLSATLHTSSKKAPPAATLAPSYLPTSASSTQPTYPQSTTNYKQAISALSAEIISTVIESSIAQVAQNTMLKRSVQANAAEKRKNDQVISRFCLNLQTMVLSEFIHEVIFDRASSATLAIHYTRQKRILLQATFCKWLKTSRLRKLRPNWKGLNAPSAQDLKVNDVSAIWIAGGLKNVVSEYVYRRALSKRQLINQEIRVLIILPVGASVVQAWVRCKFGIKAGQNRAQCMVKETSISIELVDQSVNPTPEEISRFALILVWKEKAESASSFSTQLVQSLQACLTRQMCCLAISWLLYQPQLLEKSDTWYGLPQVYLSLDKPEVQMEQALQDFWPIPSGNEARSPNNQDYWMPLTHVWKRSQRKAVTLLNAYVPESDDFVTHETRRQLKYILLKFDLGALKVVIEYMGTIVRSGSDAFAAYISETLRLGLLSDLQPATVDHQLDKYQSSLPLSTSSLNLSNLLGSQGHLTLVEFFELFGQYFFTAFLDCTVNYLNFSFSSGVDAIDQNASSYSTVLSSPSRSDESQLQKNLLSTFQLLRNEVNLLFPKPLSIHLQQSESKHVREDESGSIDIPDKKKKRQADKVADLRLLIRQTREGLK